MHAAIEFLIYWALAFISLCLGLVLLSIFNSVIDDALELQSLGKEGSIAAFAALIESTGLWVILVMVAAPYRAMGLRAMIIPILIVIIFYKIAHLTDWGSFDAILLVVFQIFVCCLIGALVSGHFGAAILATLAFAICLAVIASFAKSL